jgi:ATP-binding cassette subfamily C protein
VAVPALIERRAMAEDRRWFEKAVHNRTFLLDLLTGMARLRALGGADRLCDRWEDDYRALKARDARLRRSAGGRRVFEEACSLIVPAASVVAVAWAGVGAGAFVGCHLAAGQAAAAALGLGAVAAAVIRARYLLERAGPLLTTALEEREGKRPAAPLRGTLEGHDLHFRYEGSTARALDGVSVRVGPGEIVALAGPSGSGKSTLLRMLLGFEEPARGVVCWDGVPLAELDPHAVRAQVGAVLQEDRLMEGTTRFNIGGLSPPPKVALWEAARLAVVDDDIRRWPMQMETLLDEEKVSGSQRQRILLAGQLLRRPLLVLLDEATSALDEEVQARLFANLRGLRLPCVVVAHRPSTLWYADRIYRLHEGRVVQSGTPAEVLGEGAPPAVPPAEVWPADAEAVPLRILFRRAALERYLGPISPDAPATRPHLRFPLPTGS